MNKLQESSSLIKKLVSEGKIKEAVKGSESFFMQKALSSIAVASRLLELNEKESLDSSLWVINSSYYSIFFAATALLAKFNKKIDSEASIHILTYHAFIHYFINEDNKIEKHFIEEYRQAIEEAEQLMQISEQKTVEMLSDFKNEIAKRKIFTYDLGKNAEKIKAETSLRRAKNFVRVIEEMMAT